MVNNRPQSMIVVAEVPLAPFYHRPPGFSRVSALIGAMNELFDSARNTPSADGKFSFVPGVLGDLLALRLMWAHLTGQPVTFPGTVKYEPLWGPEGKKSISGFGFTYKPGGNRFVPGQLVITADASQVPRHARDVARVDLVNASAASAARQNYLVTTRATGRNPQKSR